MNISAIQLVLVGRLYIPFGTIIKCVVIDYAGILNFKRPH